MSKLYFILWTTLFPISMYLCGYISAKKNKIMGYNEEQKDIINILNIAIIFVWIYIAFKLW